MIFFALLPSLERLFEYLPESGNIPVEAPRVMPDDPAFAKLFGDARSNEIDISTDNSTDNGTGPIVPATKEATQATDGAMVQGQTAAASTSTSTCTAVNNPTDNGNSIVFRGVGMRYREGLDLALHDLDIIIPRGSSVGVVGRTGAGKVTLSHKDGPPSPQHKKLNE